MSSTVPLQPPYQPQSKAAPIAQLTVPTVVAHSDDEVTAKPVEKSRPRHGRPARKATPDDSSSLEPTIALIERILTPNRHAASELPADARTIEEILPPLTSSNEVDIELYAILAIIVKDFVNTWYTKITPDQEFVEETIQIIAHCTRSLEQRLRQVDVAALLLDEIPLLVKEHVEIYRMARRITSNSPYDLSLRHIYHELRPHPGLTPNPSSHDSAISQQQIQNERAYRQLLIQGTLATLLPTEDLQNGPLRVLVGDIMADLIVGQALAGKLCEGWFLHDALYRVTTILADKLHPKAINDQLPDDTKDRLEKFGLLSSDLNPQHSHSSSTSESKITILFWRVLQYGYLLYLFLRYMFRELQSVRQRPKRQAVAHISTQPSFSTETADLRPPTSTSTDQPIRPVLEFGVSGMISTLLKVADRMPWCANMLLFWQHVLLVSPIRAGGLDSVFDRFLYHAVEKYVLTASLVPVLLRSLRVALFPNNSMGPAAPPAPSPEETRKIKYRAAKSVFEMFPPLVARTYYAASCDETIISELEEDLLDPFDDAYLNKHLVYAILELILVRLIPELQVQTIGELLAERGVR